MESSFRPAGDGDAHAARQLHTRLVGDVARLRDKHLVTRLKHSARRKVNRLADAHSYQDLA